MLRDVLYKEKEWNKTIMQSHSNEPRGEMYAIDKFSFP